MRGCCCSWRWCASPSVIITIIIIIVTIIVITIVITIVSIIIIVITITITLHRWLHAWCNAAARRRIRQLIALRRTHHKLFLAFTTLKHQGITWFVTCVV